MKIAFHTLGCKVNQYETQVMKEKFIARGYEIVKAEEEADIYVVNTCTVTGLSDKKSRQFIRRVKRKNPHCITAVVGCYVQVNPEEAASIEGVNIVAGTDEKSRLVDYVEDYLKKEEQAQEVKNLSGNHNRTEEVHESPVNIKDGIEGIGERIETYVNPFSEIKEYDEGGRITSMDSRTRAYIKIQDGCNRFCSYCIIPYARGTVRSRKREEILMEATSLLEQGFKEILLTGINAALYGMEKGGALSPGRKEGEQLAFGIETVIGDLDAIDGEFRIRIGSLEPTVINKEYAMGLLQYPKLCPHFHLSLQSGSNRILKSMNRSYTVEEYVDMVNSLRKVNPHFAITTDIIVGFPGESEEDFRETLRLVESLEFAKIHVFQYSKRPGTKAADMRGHLAPEVKTRRSKELISIGKIGSQRFLEKNLGRESLVLFETYEEGTGYFTGYSDNYITVYYKPTESITDEIKGKILNNFTKIKMESLYKDGLIGTCLSIE